MHFKTRSAHLPIDETDVLEVTMNGRGALDSVESSQVVEAFNGLTFEKSRGKLAVANRIGVHIYLRSGIDVHIYPRSDQKVDVVRIEGDTRIRYIATPHDTFFSTFCS